MTFMFVLCSKKFTMLILGRKIYRVLTSCLTEGKMYSFRRYDSTDFKNCQQNDQECDIVVSFSLGQVAVRGHH